MLQASTLTIDLTNRTIIQSNPIALRDTVQVTLTNIGSLSAGNMRLALYRGSTLCATCVSFSVSGSTFIGALDLNTAEMVAEFVVVPVTPHERMSFIILVYDASGTFYSIYDSVYVENQVALAAGTPPNVNPITAGTLVFGDMRLYNGVLYKQSTGDGLWYKWTVAGAGSLIHENLDETGIVLP